MKKLVLIDVDGTLCNDSGEVPLSAKQAIEKARKNGHFVYFCTGRSLAEMVDIDVDVDGMILAGGGYIESNGKVLQHLTFDLQDMQDIVSYLDQHDIGYYLESNDGLYGSANFKDVVHRVISTQFNDKPDLAGQLEWFFKLLKDRNIADLSYINKLCFVSADHPYAEVHKQFCDRFTMHHCTIWQLGKESGEIAIKGIDKGVAIEHLMQHLNISFDNTFAFGDGLNDVPMFNKVKHRIAMENAAPGLKTIATDVTFTAQQHGIQEAFKKYQLF